MLFVKKQNKNKQTNKCRNFRTVNVVSFTWRDNEGGQNSLINELCRKYNRPTFGSVYYSKKAFSVRRSIYQFIAKRSM